MYVNNYRTKTIPTLTPELLERFWARVDKRGPDECWPWKNKPDSNGYGVFTINQRNYRATRVAVLISTGTDPSPHVVMHACNRPICVNPDHLSPGTQQQNNAFRLGQPWLRGQNHGRSKITNAQADEIRALRASGVILREIAPRFGISLGQVSQICRGKSRGHEIEKTLNV